MLARLAIESDEDVYIDLARSAVAESVRGFGFDPDRVRRVFRAYLECANPTIFVADDRRDVVGFLNASISRYDFTDGHYTTQEVIFVRPDKRGTRAAVLLVRELIAWSDRLGAREITGGNDNGLFTKRTARLLSRFGFEHVGFFMRRVRGATNGKEGWIQQGGGRRSC